MSGASRSRRLLAVNHTGLLSGAERVLIRYLRHARDDGWTVSCCAPGGALAHELDQLEVPNSEIPELKPGTGWRVPALARLAAAELRAARLIRRAAGDADVVVVNGLMALPAVALARVSRPVIWLVHDNVVRHDLQLVVRRFSNAVDLAVAPSEASGRYPRECGIHVRISANGVDLPAKPRGGSWPEPPVVGINAAITEWKGHMVLLDAVAGLPDVILEVMGSPFPADVEYAKCVEARADEPDLAGRVRFLGQVDDPLERMRGWTVAVSASIEPEAGSLAVLEAMSLALPIVATDHGCVPEYTEGAAVLVPVGDVEAMRTAVEKLVSDEPQREALAAAARSRVADSYTLDHARARFVDVLDETAAVAEESSA